MSDRDTTASRRTVLERASVATAGLLTAAGTVAASDGRQANVGTLKDCGVEYDCKSHKCGSGYNTEYKRECCEYDDGTIECSSWEATGDCCL